METEEVLKCSECAAPIKEGQERCDYCGYWFKTKFTIKLSEINSLEPTDWSDLSSGDPLSFASTTIDVMVAIFLALIASIIGLNLIPYIAQAVAHP